MRRAGLVVAVLVAALLSPARAGAAPGLEVGMEDERLLLGDTSGAAQAAVAEWRALGVDVVRLHARWWIIAPGRRSASPPSGFDAANHRDRRYAWGELDRAVDMVRAAGLKVALTVTGPGPLWTSRTPRLHDARIRPDPKDFARFARAAATRYRGRVARYLLWNEPNQPGWLRPQSECVRRVCTAVAPHLYRGLVRAAEPAIHAADPDAEVLIGELAPIGADRGGPANALAPLPFLRAMACVDRAYRAQRGGPCAAFRPAAGDAFGYHPHPVNFAPDQHNPDREEAQLADMGRLVAVLDRLTRTGRIRAPGGRFAIDLTEFGYQTSPPDHSIGIPLARHAQWLQEAAYIAWGNDRVRNLTHYQWEDEPVFYRAPGKLSYAGWQSGLKLIDGTPKPALLTFPSPLVADPRGGGASVRLWGQVRPGAAHAVTLLRRTPGSPDYAIAAQLQTDAEGYWTTTVPRAPGTAYRAAWEDGLSAQVTLPSARELTAATP